jgi:hypothetical protein
MAGHQFTGLVHGYDDYSPRSPNTKLEADKFFFNVKTDKVSLTSSFWNYSKTTNPVLFTDRTFTVKNIFYTPILLFTYCISLSEVKFDKL